MCSGIARRLSANPGLWSSITEAIDNCRFFLMLASPEAAQSEWCQREVEHWRAQHGLDGMLLLLTGGEIVWDAATQRFRLGADDRAARARSRAASPRSRCMWTCAGRVPKCSST